MTRELTQPPHGYGTSVSAGALAGAGPEAPFPEALGPPLAPESTVPQLTLTTAIDADELLLFRSDLRSTLEAVVVCALGRALMAHPDVNLTVAEGPAGPVVAPAPSALVELLVLCDDGLRTGTIDAGHTRSLLDVRDAVANLVDGLRAGRPPHCREPAALSLSTFALSGGVPPRPATPPVSSVLAVGRITRVARSMQVGLSVDSRVIEADQASGLLATIVRLLEHPYRRLR